MKALILLFVLFVSGHASAQMSPLPSGANTIALWNFDEESGDILDSASAPMDGQGYTVTHSPVPGLGTEFGSAYQFTLPSSFIDFGPVRNTKLDFTGASQLSIEAIIHLTSAAPSTHAIVDFENVKLEVINNQLVGVVRQPGGLLGVVSPTQLQQNTSYRVGLHYTSGLLILTINGVINAKIVVNNAISAPQFSNSRAYIGGNIFGQLFPGYIDDVRISSSVLVDYQEPVVELVEPQFQVSNPRPQFRIQLSDVGTGVDVSTVQVFLNGNLQTGLTITSASITGQMTDNFSTTLLNEVKVQLSDLAGNSTEKKFYFTYLNVLFKTEYETDEHTLALWHMNDFSITDTEDSSGNAHHGYSAQRTITSGDGVFSKGRYFTANRGSLINFDGLRFDQEFTVEGWFKPSSTANDDVLFYNGQISIIRYGLGNIRLVFFTSGQTLVYETPMQILPSGELHHLAVTWSGLNPTDNLKFYQDGTVAHTTTAIRNCDFDPLPKAGYMGTNYNGMMDEVRVSSNVRLGFNIPTVDNQIITFMTLKDGTGVTVDYPEFHAVMNSVNSIELSTLKVKLNGVLQPLGTGLIATQTSIDGTMADAVKEGVNILEIEFVDNVGNYRKKSQYFIKSTLNGAAEYEVTPETAGLWHFNSDAPLKDTSASNTQTNSNYNPVSGVFENAQRWNTNTVNTIKMNCRAFTVEGYFKRNSDTAGDVGAFSFSGTGLSSEVGLTSTNGNVRVAIDYNAGAGSTTVLPGALPLDSAFHHLALVYDGSRTFGQLMFFVDGNLKMAQDFRSFCNAQQNFSLGINGDYYQFDEVRVSRKANYSFNIAKPGTGKAILSASSLPDTSTVSTATVAFSATTEDSVGVDVVRSKLYVNGTEVPLTAQNKARLTTILQADLPLTVGSNSVKLKLFNLSGNQTVKIWNITRSGK